MRRQELVAQRLDRRDLVRRQRVRAVLVERLRERELDLLEDAAT